MSSNKDNNPKHGPGYVCYKDGAPGKGKKAKANRSKQIAAGRQRARELAQLNGR